MAEQLVTPPRWGYLTGPQAADTLPTMIFQHPLSISIQEFAALGELSNKPPFELTQGLLSGACQVYRAGKLLAMVEQEGETLHLRAVVQEGKPGSGWRKLTAGLQRLAREWGCSQLETYTEQPMVVGLLERHGARIAGWQVVMEV